MTCHEGTKDHQSDDRRDVSAQDNQQCATGALSWRGGMMRADDRGQGFGIGAPALDATGKVNRMVVHGWPPSPLHAACEPCAIIAFDVSITNCDNRIC